MNQVTKLIKFARNIPWRNITSINLPKSEQVFEDEYLSIMAHKHCNYGEFYTNKFRIKKQPKKIYSYWKNVNCFDRRPKDNKIYLDDEDEYLTKMANLHIMGTD